LGGIHMNQRAGARETWSARLPFGKATSQTGNGHRHHSVDLYVGGSEAAV
jgi:hypothetical protein